jgi:hypothetical protein
MEDRAVVGCNRARKKKISGMRGLNFQELVLYLSLSVVDI